MLICMLSMWCFFQQEFHYLDGTVINLKNGVVIKTFESITYDPDALSWREDGEFVVIPKLHIQSVGTFSMRIRGRAPHRKYNTASERRVNGQTVSYQRNGETHFTVRKVDAHGRSAEGRLTHNIIKEAKVVAGSPEEGQTLEILLTRTKPGYEMEMRFFDLKGRQKQSFSMDLDLIQQDRDQDKRHQFDLEPGLNPSEVGLVEMVVKAKKDK